MKQNQRIIKEVLDLPVSDRIRLVKKVLDSIAEEHDDLELSDDELEELERRVEEHRRNPSSAIPFETVMAEMTRKKR